MTTSPLVHCTRVGLCSSYRRPFGFEGLTSSFEIYFEPVFGAPTVYAELMSTVGTDSDAWEPHARVCPAGTLLPDTARNRWVAVHNRGNRSS